MKGTEGRESEGSGVSGKNFINLIHDFKIFKKRKEARKKNFIVWKDSNFSCISLTRYWKFSNVVKTIIS